MADTFVLIQKDNSGNELEVWLFSTLANAQAQQAKLGNGPYSAIILHTAQAQDATPPSKKRDS